MSAKDGKAKRQAKPTVEDFLGAAPYANEAMTVTPARDGGALVSIPMKRPNWLVPPLSWVIPFSPHRRVKLDAVGYCVLKLCDGKRNVETIIEEFAESNKLSFREAQLPVTQFLRQMTQRGLIVIVGTEKKAGIR